MHRNAGVVYEVTGGSGWENRRWRGSVGSNGGRGGRSCDRRVEGGINCGLLQTPRSGRK